MSSLYSLLLKNYRSSNSFASKVRCVCFYNVGNIIGGNKSKNEHRNDTPPFKHQRRTFEKGGSSFGQLSCERRIMASKYQHSDRTMISTSSICRENNKQNMTKVHLKDFTRLVVGRGVVKSQLQTRDDVVGLILFPHQVAVRVMEVYACGVHESNEDGQVLRECIG